MEKRIDKELGRQELADLLESLVKDLRRGKLRIQSRDWTIPGTLKAKIRFQEKRGRFATKIKWSWMTLEDYDRAGREEIARWEQSLKALKKALNASFGKLKRITQQGGFPDDKTMATFAELSQAFSDVAEPEWQEAMDEYMDHVENFQRAVKDRHLEAMLHELRDMGSRMKACHREFK
jgi:XXXCH domain-containing protein